MPPGLGRAGGKRDGRDGPETGWVRVPGLESGSSEGGAVCSSGWRRWRPTNAVCASPRPSVRTGCGQLLGLAVVGVAFFWALPAFASYDEVWSRLGDISPGYGIALAAVGAINLAAPASVQCAALPGLRFTRSHPRRLDHLGDHQHRAGGKCDGARGDLDDVPLVRSRQRPDRSGDRGHRRLGYVREVRDAPARPRLVVDPTPRHRRIRSGSGARGRFVRGGRRPRRDPAGRPGRPLAASAASWIGCR